MAVARRYWEHLIRDDVDFERQVDLRAFNPVKHGWVARAAGRPNSSIHRYLRRAKTLEFTVFTPTYRATASKPTDAPVLTAGLVSQGGERGLPVGLASARGEQGESIRRSRLPSADRRMAGDTEGAGYPAPWSASRNPIR